MDQCRNDRPMQSIGFGDSSNNTMEDHHAREIRQAVFQMQASATQYQCEAILDHTNKIKQHCESMRNEIEALVKKMHESEGKKMIPPPGEPLINKFAAWLDRNEFITGGGVTYNMLLQKFLDHFA